MRERKWMILILSLSLILSCGRRITTTGDEGMGRIKGVVVTEDGSPVDGAEVTLIERWETWITDNGGVFVIPDILSGSVCSVMIRKGEEGALVQGIIVDGETDIGMVKIKEVGSIKGKVVGDFEDEFEGSDVYLIGTPFSGKVGKDGSFRIGWVPEGRYRAAVRYMEKEAEIGEYEVISGEELDIGRKSVGRTILAVLYSEIGGCFVRVMGLDGGGAKDVFHMKEESETIRKIWGPGQYPIALSPDGKRLAVIDPGSGDIVVIDIATGERWVAASPSKIRSRYSSRLRSPKYFTPPPFPDMPPLSSVVSEMFQPSCFQCLSWSPDGSWISAVYWGADIKDGKVIKIHSYGVVLNPNGPPDQDPLLLSRFDGVRGIGWSPKGDAIVTVTNVWGEARFHTFIERRGMDPLEIPDMGTIFSLPCWSPDGKKIYYYNNNWSAIMVADVDGGYPRPFVAQTGWKRIAIPVGFTHAGKRIFIWEITSFFSSDWGDKQARTLWAVRVDGTDPVKIMESVLDFNPYALDVSIAHIW